MNPTLTRFTRLVGKLKHDTDGKLLAAFLAGNQAAFRELVDRHASLVFRVCNRILRHQQDAEDAFQAVFIVLARRAGDVWPQDAVGSWLYGVASRVALKARTLRARRWSREETLEEVPQPSGPISEPDIADVIDRAVRKLPEVYRVAVVACDLEGLSRRDAARRLGWTEGTLSGRLARARKLLADCLRKTGTAFPAAGLAVVLGANSTIRAGLIDTVMNLVSTASGVPAPVAALTQGVMPSMFAFKIKTAVAAILVISTVGFGAWRVGAEDDPGGQETKNKSATPPAIAKPQSPDLAKMRAELKLIEQELAVLIEDAKAAGPNPPEKVERRIQQLESRLAEFRRMTVEAREQPKPIAPKPLTVDSALKPLEGRWKIDSIADGNGVQPADPKVDLVIEIAGNKFFMPYRESGGALKRQEYSLTVGDSRQFKTIDLIQPGKPVAHGIYQLGATAETCAKCHVLPFGDVKPGKSVIYGLCDPALNNATALHLTLAMNGMTPTKFGGAEGVLDFQLSRVGSDQAPKNPHEEAWERAIRTRTKLLIAQKEVQDAIFAEEQAQLRLTLAKANAEQARAKLEEAASRLKLIEEELKKNADKPVPLAKPPVIQDGKDDTSFTVHIRTYFAPEKVVRVKATGEQTVLDGLEYAKEYAEIKPDVVTVWVLRGKSLMLVDLAAIKQKGNSMSNYQLKPGDRLFVQVTQLQ